MCSLESASAKKLLPSLKGKMDLPYIRQNYLVCVLQTSKVLNSDASI